jgi:hypothetical protein
MQMILGQVDDYVVLPSSEEDYPTCPEEGPNMQIAPSLYT